MSKRRYHIQQGEPNDNGEHEWNVLDRWKTHPHCQGCPGECVAALITRKAARKECARLNTLNTDTRNPNPNPNPNPNDEGHTP